MNYFKCNDCYRVHTEEDISSGKVYPCVCGSYRVKESTEQGYQESLLMAKMLERMKNEQKS